MSAQSMEALAKANRHRLAWAGLRRDIKSGEASVAATVFEYGEDVANMPVFDVLRAQHRWGRQRALRVMRAAGIPEAKTLGSLSARQRSILLRHVDADL